MNYLRSKTTDGLFSASRYIYRTSRDYSVEERRLHEQISKYVRR
jgi:hypothetical protein